jgi:hypothetical protein
MKHNKPEVKVPESSDERASKETVSGAPNTGSCCCAQPVIDAGADSGPGVWSGDGQDVAFTPAGS